MPGNETQILRKVGLFEHCSSWNKCFINAVVIDKEFLMHISQKKKKSLSQNTNYTEKNNVTLAFQVYAFNLYQCQPHPQFFF